MYEYKCVGTYYDITPCSFLDVQNDLNCRKEWDSNVLSLELLKEEDEHEVKLGIPNSHDEAISYVQNDLNCRKEWDSNVLSLELLKEEDEHELIRWVQKYPYPLYPREYVYARRTWVSDDSQMIVVDSEVVPVDVVPGSSKNVRVSTYTSRMAVRSHREFDELGLAFLDFILTYFDNPEANIPRTVYNWIVNHG
ncbi:unnamed protein product, partial [Strongylus vulgaris]